ncbi:hypothetical protein [Nocardioides sp. GXZ039]|uniref:hypothetical protein n=1 Tax=Nocardioides sp. GXZ039 TaxID=3136018 RepID=UPI0030F408CA
MSADADTDRGVEALERELVLLRSRVRRLERDLASLRPLVRTARDLTPWDFTPYQLEPGGDWVAVDRQQIEELLAALAGVDHWAPWRTPIEPRPQP